MFGYCLVESRDNVCYNNVSKFSSTSTVHCLEVILKPCHCQPHSLSVDYSVILCMQFFYNKD